MALSVSELEEAIIALRYAADGGVFPTGDRLFVEAVKPLEAELSRLLNEQDACPSCDMWIVTTNDHLSVCKTPDWLPAAKEEADAVDG